VNSLKKGDSMEAQITAAVNQGIKVLACGLSLKEADLKPGDLSSKVAVVENGLWEMIRQQSDGTLSIEL
jgi:intracellular sulfur oxidation DsrE/DsrF family protein